MRIDIWIVGKFFSKNNLSANLIESDTYLIELDSKDSLFFNWNQFPYNQLSSG